ncbi:MAG TPA: OmpA family protein [Tepidisphaeraceae bacterium]|nr:OmpA family protein [Tepidisphaeraceae bacterium]
MHRVAKLMIIVAAALLAGGCKNALYDENVQLHQQNRELQAQLDSKNAQLRSAPDPAQMQAMQGEILDRDRKISELQSQLRQPTPVAPGAPPPDPAIAGIETSYDAKAGTMTVNLPGDVLFDVGKADLKASAKTTLNKIAAALKRDYQGKPVRVEGHTDADPIRATKDQWEDNLDLSLGRAAAVSRYLEQQGVSPKLVTTSGFGEHRPRGNTKAKNRRVEIVVVLK